MVSINTVKPACISSSLRDRVYPDTNESMSVMRTCGGMSNSITNRLVVDRRDVMIEYLAAITFYSTAFFLCNGYDYCGSKSQFIVLFS